MVLSQVKGLGRLEGTRKQKMLPTYLGGGGFFNLGLWVSHAKPYLEIRNLKGPVPISNL